MDKVRGWRGVCFCVLVFAAWVAVGCSPVVGPAPTRLAFTPTESANPPTREVPTAVPVTATPTALPTVSTPHNFTPTSPPPTRIPPSPTPAPGLCSPLEDHTFEDLLEIVTNPFAPPAPGKDDGHHGVDFAYYRRGERMSIAGVVVQSMLAGRVAARLENEIPYGNMVMVESQLSNLPPGLADRLGISSGRSLYLVYAHMQAPSPTELGQTVACGEALGAVGNTPSGWSSNPHLHLEARLGPASVVFEEMMYYDNSGTPLGMENYRRWRMSGEFEMIDPLLLFAP